MDSSPPSALSILIVKELCLQILLSFEMTSEEENMILRAREEGREQVKENLEERVNKLEKIHPQI